MTPAARAARGRPPSPGGDVDYIGEVAGDDKHRLLADAVCLLNPITWPEPFGMVMIEALARGTPVVATPMGAAPEIVDDGRTGYLRSGDEGLTQALLAAADLDRSTCRRAAEQHFSMERMAHDDETVYAGLVGAGRTRDAELVSILDEGSANGPTAFESGVPLSRETTEEDGQAGLRVAV